MEIDLISAEEYSNIFREPLHAFNSVPFNILNSAKCDHLYFLLLHENKKKIGIILGETNSVLKSPFSAPSGGFSFNDEEMKLFYIDQAIERLIEFAAIENKSLKITLPPEFYHSSLLSKTIFSLFYHGFSVSPGDINYHFKINDLYKYDTGEVDRSCRNNLRRAENMHLSVKKIESENEKKEAYLIIKINKEEKNRPLHLSFEQLKSTESIIPMDYFMVFYNHYAIASAIVYHVAKSIVQIIYWGDRPDSRELRPMNFLALQIFKHYSNNGIRIVDLGTSTEYGTPNYGLCDFKENIACTASLKYSLVKSPNGHHEAKGADNFVNDMYGIQ